MSTTTTQQKAKPFTVGPITFEPVSGMEGVPFWAQPMAHAPKGIGEEMGIYGPDPEQDRIEKCGPYLLCIRPPSPLTNSSYIVRIYHQDTKEVVIAMDPPVRLYNAFHPESAFATFMGLCWWPVPEHFSFFAKYEDQIVCYWGGEMAVRQLPYERGPDAGPAYIRL